MKSIRFTQNINLNVEIEASVPDDWTDKDVKDFVTDCVVGITIDDPDDHLENGTEVDITSLILWDAKIANGRLLEVSNA